MLVADSPTTAVSSDASLIKVDGKLGTLPPLLAEPAITSRANICIEARRSDVEGFGVFALERIEAGQPWWTFDPVRHIIVSPEQHNLILWASKLHPEKFAKLEDAMHRYCFHSKLHDMGVYCLDDSRYTNFSDTPNSRPAQGYYSSLPEPIHLPRQVYSHVAIRPVEKGEEILENYAEYDGGEWCKFLMGAWVDDPNRPTCEMGEKPVVGRHVLFELSKEQMEVLKGSQLPEGPGRAFYDCVEEREDGSGVIDFTVDN